MQKTDEQYYQKVTEFAKQYGPLPSNHILDIMVSVMRTRDNDGWQGGGFVTAVIQNNLSSAISRADNDCLSNLKLIVATKENCHF
jgi:hypothetical protein